MLDSLRDPVKIVRGHRPTRKLVDASHDGLLGNVPVLVARNRSHRRTDASGNLRLRQAVLLSVLEECHA